MTEKEVQMKESLITREMIEDMRSKLGIKLRIEDSDEVCALAKRIRLGRG
jgi:hypothetical protein